MTRGHGHGGGGGRTWLPRLVPAVGWWGRVNRRTLRADLVAGLTGAVVALPQGVAFAVIAGMPPEYGLYTCIVPAMVAAWFGSSWHLVSGPTTAASILLFAVLSHHAEPGSAAYVQLALTLTFMVGTIELLMGLARLGELVNFISHSVVVGFTAGAAILIATNQLKYFFGVAVPAGSSFHETLFHLAGQVGAFNPHTLVVGLVTMGVGIGVRRLHPAAPHLILALAAGSGVAALLAHGLPGGAPGVTTVGALPASLPPLSAPDFDAATIRQLAPAALAVALLALTEAVSIGRSLALRSGQLLDGNQEFIGQGLSNLAGSFFSSYVATGSFNRSGLNYGAGARTPLAALSAAGFLAVIVLLVASWGAHLPHAAMAGILFLVAWGLIDSGHIRHTLESSRSESLILGVTFTATLFLSLEMAILLGVFLSLGFYLRRTAHPQVVPCVPDATAPRRTFGAIAQHPQCPQVGFVRIDGDLFFGAINHVQNTLMAMDREHPGQNHLAIVAISINLVDLAGCEFLADEARRRRKRGGDLYLIRAKRPVQRQLRLSGALRVIGRGNLFNSKGEAVATIHRRLDPKICQGCTTRIFLECQPAPVREEGGTLPPVTAG